MIVDVPFNWMVWFELKNISLLTIFVYPLMKIMKINFLVQFSRDISHNSIEIALEVMFENSSHHWFRLWLGAIKQQAIT